MTETTVKYNTNAITEEPEERLLWVYRTHSRWSRKPKPDCTTCEGSGVGLMTTENEPIEKPCHCIRNSSGGTKGSKVELALDDILAENTIEKVLGELRTPIDPATVWDFKTEVFLHTRETWYCIWFQHAQPDWGDSDADVLTSFQRYVDRIIRFNQRNQESYEPGGTLYDPICLMGAEDRWRWRGEGQGDPPCRCAGCKKFGVVRIDH